MSPLSFLVIFLTSQIGIANDRELERQQHPCEKMTDGSKKAKRDKRNKQTDRQKEIHTDRYIYRHEERYGERMMEKVYTR